MDVDRSLLGSPKPTDGGYSDRENADRNEPDVSLVAKVLTPALFNRSPDGTSQAHKAAMSPEEEKLAAMIRVGRKSSGFGEGVRRESFPGKHLHTPDLSFNCEEAFIGDRSYSSDIAHDEGMSFVYNARSSTPVSAHAIPLPATVRRTRSDSDTGVKPYSDVSHERGSQTPLPLPATNLEGSNILPATSPKPRAACPRSPLAFEVDTDTQGKGMALSRESEPVLSQQSSSEGAQLKGAPIIPVASLKSLSARAAALRFILPEDSLMEMDSILDVQFPGGVEDEFTAAFARLALGSSGNEPKATKLQSTTPEPTTTREEQEPPVLDQQEPPVLVEVKSQDGASSGESAPNPDEGDGSYLEDEHTLNIASLGISEFGNTLLMDMSLDQLRSKPEIEHENTTFGGSSFVVTTSSAAEWPAEAIPEAQTPKRTASNPLPYVEDRDANIEATVKKPRPANGRVVSDAVVDALRSGRALHRVTNSISAVDNPVGLINKVEAADGTPLGKPIWPGSTASLRRTESFTSYPSSAAPLQRTRSTMSLRRTSSATSYQPDFIRPHSRASALDFDSDDDQPYTPSIPTMSRGSSRRSSVYALPEPGIPNDHPASYLERPSSVASIYDRPTSAASIRPTSAASIRPTSAASIRTSSTRPTSVASSLRSGSSRRVSGAHIQPSSAEEELVRGLETLMRGDMRKTSHNAQEAQHVRTTKIAGVGVSATRDNRGVTRSGIRQPPGSSAPRATGMGTKSALGAPKALGSKILSGMPGSKHPVGSGAKSTVTGTGGAKTMSAASGRTASVTTGSGTRSTTSTLRSQLSVKSSSTRTRASTLGLFAPDGGPGAGQEPKKPTHKPSSASISATPSTTRTLRPPTTASSVRTLGARGVGAPTVPTRAATTAGSIASLREAMKSKETSKR